MEESEKSLSEWLSIVSVFISDNSTNKEKLAAKQKINSKLESTDYSFINQVISWFRQNLDNEEVWELVSQTFTPSYITQIENYNEYFNKEENREDLKYLLDTVFQSIKSDNELMRQNAAKILTIFLRLDEKFVEFQKLNALLKDKDQPRTLHKAIVFLFSYLNSSFTITFDPKQFPALSETFGLVIDLLISHLEDMSDPEIYFKISILQLVSSICKSSSLLFLLENNRVELVKDIGIILDIYNEQLTKQAVNTLGQVFHIYYWTFTDQECDDIIMMTKKYLDLKNKKLTDAIQIYFLLFWEDVAKYEVEIINSSWSQVYSSKKSAQEKNVDKMPIQECQNRSGQAAIELFDCFIDIISRIDPNSIEVEEISRMEPSIVATEALAWMYKAVPTSIHEALKVKLEEFIVSDKWYLKNAAAMIVYIFSSNPYEKIASWPFVISVIKYLHEKFFDISSLMNTTNQRLRETAMWALSELIFVYPNVIIDFSDPGLVVNRIMDLFSIPNKIDETTHPLILLRTSSILFNIIKAFKPIHSSNPLCKDKVLFERIYKYLIMVSALPQCNIRSKVFVGAYDTIALLIQRTPKMVQFYPCIMKDSVEILNQLESLPEEQKIGNVVFSDKESALCYMLSQLIMKNTDDLSDYATDLTSTLFKIVSRDDKLVLENALQTLISIISLSKPIHLEIPDTIFENLVNILTNYSTNISIMRNTTTLISYIFSLIKGEFPVCSFDLLESLHDAMYKEGISISVLPNLLNAYSDIIMTTFSNSKENSNKYKDQFLEIIKQYRDLKFDTNGSEYVKTLNEILESCCKAFNCYGNVFFKGSDKKHEREILNEVTKLSQVIYDNKDQLTHTTIKTSLGVLKTFILNASPQNKNSLSKGINAQLISLGTGHKDLNDYASFINNSIKFRGKGPIAARKSKIFAVATKAREAAFASLPDL